MVRTERKKELLSLWRSEQNDSWRDDWEESTKWREDLTSEEKALVEAWDREPPESVKYDGRCISD